MSNYNYLIVENIDDILHITINRPASLNALNRLTIQELGQAMQTAYNSADVKGVILIGAGERAFVAGADISEFTGLSKEEAKALSQAGHEVFNSIENCPKPVMLNIDIFSLVIN